MWSSFPSSALPHQAQACLAQEWGYMGSITAWGGLCLFWFVPFFKKTFLISISSLTCYEILTERWPKKKEIWLWPSSWSVPVIWILWAQADGAIKPTRLCRFWFLQFSLQGVSRGASWHTGLCRGGEEEGAFLPVPFNESSDSHLQLVHTADAELSPHLCWSPFSLSFAVGGLLKQDYGLVGSSTSYRSASTISQ